MAGNNFDKLKNLSAQGYPPIPDILVPPLPEKIRRIDPDGCDKWTRTLNETLSNWIKTQNVLQTGLQSSLPQT